MKNEFKADRVIVYDKDCLGAKKTKTDIMISFINDERGFEFIDVFMKKETTLELIEQLKKQLNGY